ncbi:MAG: hypothetical protein SPI51_03845, partial [Candidatus Enterosoma sp.]|nr:hypothetical protein [Candidatus Enterosoma sp.]
EKNPEYNFDSFICVKVTKDEQKNTTEDAHAADKVYNFLKSKQRNPFYSEVICNNLAGADYEAMILYALYKAKAMILICFDEAYLETPWVKNEHTRYRRMIQDGLKDPDSLLILYKGTPIERLSIDDHKREGINLANPSAYSSLLDRVDMLCTIAVPTLERKKYGKTKVTKKSVQSTNIQKRTLATIKKQEVTVSDQNNLKIMSMMMESEDYNAVLAYGLGLIQDNPSFSDAYVLMFLAQQGVQTLDDFIKSTKPVESFEYFEKALATKENPIDHLPLIQALANRTNDNVDLKCYQEFISLPDSTDEMIDDLNNRLFPKLLKSNNVEFFLEMTKTISDQDFYINANLSFAHKNSGKASMVFYQNILDIDPSDPEALFNVFAAKIDFDEDDEDTVTDYLADKENQKDVGESLYKYGFNAFATDQIYESLYKALVNENSKATAAFDCLIRFIPEKENKRYIQYLHEFVNELLWQEKFEEARKYNEYILEQDPNDDEAYFSRIMIQNNLHNPVEILTLDQDLFQIPDYVNAMKAYTVKHPKEKNNLYLQIREAKKTVHDSLCADPIIKKEFIEEEWRSIQEIVACAELFPSFLEKKTETYYQQFVKETGVNENNMQRCMYDLSQNKNAVMGLKYAQLSHTRLDFFKFIVQEQARNSLRLREKQSKNKNSYWISFSIQAVLAALICVFSCFSLVPVLSNRLFVDFALDNQVISYLPVILFFVLYLGMNLVFTIIRRGYTTYNDDPMPGDTKYYNIYPLLLYVPFVFIISSDFLSYSAPDAFFTYFGLGSISLLLFSLINNFFGERIYDSAFPIWVRVFLYLFPACFILVGLVTPPEIETVGVLINSPVFLYSLVFALSLIGALLISLIFSKPVKIIVPLLLAGIFALCYFSYHIWNTSLFLSLFIIPLGVVLIAAIGKYRSHWISYLIQAIIAVFILAAACIYFVPLLTDRFIFDFINFDPVVPYLPIILFFVLYLGMNLVFTIVRSNSRYDLTSIQTKYYNIYPLFLYVPLLLIMNTDFLRLSSPGVFFTYFVLGSLSLLIFSLLNNLRIESKSDDNNLGLFNFFKYILPVFFLLFGFVSSPETGSFDALSTNPIPVYVLAFILPVITYLLIGLVDKKKVKILTPIMLILILILTYVSYQVLGVSIYLSLIALPIAAVVILFMITRNHHWISFSIQVIVAAFSCAVACFGFVPLLAERFFWDFLILNPVVPYLPVILFFVLYLGMNLVFTLIKSKDDETYGYDTMPGDSKFYNIYPLALYIPLLALIINSDFFHTAEPSVFFTYFGLGSLSLLLFSLLNNLCAERVFDDDCPIAVRIFMYILPLAFLVFGFVTPAEKMESSAIVINAITLYSFVFALPLGAALVISLYDSTAGKIAIPLVALGILFVSYLSFHVWAINFLVLIGVVIGIIIVLGIIGFFVGL